MCPPLLKGCPDVLGYGVKPCARLLSFFGLFGLRTAAGRAAMKRSTARYRPGLVLLLRERSPLVATTNHFFNICKCGNAL